MTNKQRVQKTSLNLTIVSLGLAVLVAGLVTFLLTGHVQMAATLAALCTMVASLLVQCVILWARALRLQDEDYFCDMLEGKATGVN